MTKFEKSEFIYNVYIFSAVAFALTPVDGGSTTKFVATSFDTLQSTFQTAPDSLDTTEIGRPQIQKYAWQLILEPDINGSSHVALFVKPKRWTHMVTFLSVWWDRPKRPDRSKRTTFKADPEYSGRTKPKWSVPFDVATEITGILGWMESAHNLALRRFSLSLQVGRPSSKAREKCPGDEVAKDRLPSEVKCIMVVCVHQKREIFVRGKSVDESSFGYNLLAQYKKLWSLRCASTWVHLLGSTNKATWSGAIINCHDCLWTCSLPVSVVHFWLYYGFHLGLCLLFLLWSNIQLTTRTVHLYLQSDI